MSLRDELRGDGGVPPFGIVLPTGWMELQPTREAFQELGREASARFRTAGRPDLDAQLRSLVESASRQFLSRDPVRMYLPRPADGDAPVLPLTMTAARVTGPDGRSLDGWVSSLVAEHGAIRFGPGEAMVRWETSTAPRLQDRRVPIRSVSYLIPIPGTGRRRALQFTAVIPLGDPPEMPDEVIESLMLLCDAMISTFTWGVPDEI